MDLTFLGAAQEVGRSCVLLNAQDKIMMDCGLKVHSETPYPAEPPVMPDFAIISHAHLDHSGFAPALYRQDKAEIDLHTAHRSTGGDNRRRLDEIDGEKGRAPLLPGADKAHEAEHHGSFLQEMV